ncbi:MAG: UvrD-helicase domain-containing protein [Oscillospiraceae bacterium]|jgi:DNA helicase-2/ATP-dependent DNA helicase PcrA|nr:UvrD-helicase domain-containing protein [Oscillospiraceae bacterium]
MNELEFAACLEYRRQIIAREFSRMNDMQRQAVFSAKGPLLVLAGAGSGKTTVLVNRVACLLRYGSAYESDAFAYELRAEDVELLRRAAQGDGDALDQVFDLLPYQAPPPWSVLAITFTNKAASEMKERLAAMLGAQADGIWAGTFHSVCGKLLRRHDGGLPGFNSHFAIYDAEDSRRVMKEALRQLDINEKFMPHKQILYAVGRAKDQLITPGQYCQAFGNEEKQRVIARAYERYQQLLLRANAMDFDDMIFHTVHMLEQNHEIRAQYQRRFRYLLVDEYQDTNHAQEKLISILAQGHGNLCVVGDDDQSIYKFRGATIENILQFERQYPAARVVRLEQNYRSTQNILDAANRVIANNEGRKGKELWTGNGAGEEVFWQICDDERDEARFIAERIQQNVAKGAAWGDHAVLYRSSALSNAIEQQLVRAAVPYRVIGGRRFYERKQIRDAIAYLTVIANPADEVRLRRIINEPKRGIGETTVQLCSNIAAREGITFYEVTLHAGDYPELSRAAAKLTAFAQMIRGLREAQEQLNLKELLELTLQRTGYAAALEQDPETLKERREDLQELASNLLRYEEEEEAASLWGFLEEVALLSDIDQYNAQSDAVVLMTLHAAKGLEFPCVFLPAWEERVFPSYQTLMSGGQEDLEEERRLAYVGITRAKERLCFSTTRTRMLYAQTQYNPPSRFLREAGLQEAQERRAPPTRVPWQPRRATEPLPRPAPEVTPPAAERFVPGDAVHHPSFGPGMVLSTKPMGNDTLLEVAFDRVGTKKLMANYAKLEHTDR